MKLLFAFIICLLMVGCLGKKKAESGVNVLDKTERADYCIGRYQVSLPEGFSQIPGTLGEFRPVSMPAEEPAIGLELVALGLNPQEFGNKVQARISELSEAKKGSGLDYLAHYKALEHGAVQLRIGNVDTFYKSEVHALKGQVYIVASLESAHDQFGIAEARLNEFVNGIVVAGSMGDIGKGFCIGPLTVNGDFRREWYSFAYRSSKHPDLLVEINIDTFSKNDPETLFERVGGSKSLLSIFDIKHSVIRKRELITAGMRAQEWLGAAKMPEKKNKQYNFSLETIRPTPTKITPIIHVDFRTGENGLDGAEQETSIDETQAVSIWDGLIGSISPRK